MKESNLILPEEPIESTPLNVEIDPIKQSERTVSRRQFLKGTILGVAGLAVSNFVPESKASDKEAGKEISNFSVRGERKEEKEEKNVVSGAELSKHIQEYIEIANKELPEEWRMPADRVYIIKDRKKLPKTWHAEQFGPDVGGFYLNKSTYIFADHDVYKELEKKSKEFMADLLLPYTTAVAYHEILHEWLEDHKEIYDRMIKLFEQLQSHLVTQVKFRGRGHQDEVTAELNKVRNGMLKGERTALAKAEH